MLQQTKQRTTSRLNDITDALRNPHAWIGAIFMATLVTVPTGLLDKLGETPRNTEAQQADDMLQAQHQDDQAAAAARDLSMLCGGENAVGIPVPKGVQCYDHRGRKTKLITGLNSSDSQGQGPTARIFGVRLQQMKHESANSERETKSAGLVLAGFLKGYDMSLLEKKFVSKQVVDLSGPDGNAFFLLGRARGLAKQLGKEFAPISKEMMSGDYRNLVETFDRHFGEYVDLVLPDNWDEYKVSPE